MSGPGPLDFGPEPPRAEPPPQATEAPPAARAVRSRYSWFLGLALIALLAGVTVNTLTGEGLPTGGPEEGHRLAPFAVPLAEAPPREDEDANVDRERACDVRGPGILNMCEEWERGPVVFALFPSDMGGCREVMEQMDRLAPRFPGVRFVAVGSKKPRDALAGDHPYPVGWDRDGAVASVYGLAGCPQVTYAYRGGVVMQSTREPLTDAQMSDRIRRLQG